jgi:hypothetical protein
MLSTPDKRFWWSRRERMGEITFFRSLLKSRRRAVTAPKGQAPAKWKPAPWTPWLWVKQ